MDIEKVVLEDDLEQASVEAADYKHRVAMTYVGVQALIEHYDGRPEYALVIKDLRKLERLLDGYYVDVNSFKYAAS